MLAITIENKWKIKVAKWGTPKKKNILKNIKQVNLGQFDHRNDFPLFNKQVQIVILKME
jgi:hypothetical protein